MKVLGLLSLIALACCGARQDTLRTRIEVTQDRCDELIACGETCHEQAVACVELAHMLVMRELRPHDCFATGPCADIEARVARARAAAGRVDDLLEHQLIMQNANELLNACDEYLLRCE